MVGPALAEDRWDLPDRLHYGWCGHCGGGLSIHYYRVGLIHVLEVGCSACQDAGMTFSA